MARAGKKGVGLPPGAWESRLVSASMRIGKWPLGRGCRSPVGKEFDLEMLRILRSGRDASRHITDQDLAGIGLLDKEMEARQLI